jgi:hypothetical protein
MIQTVNNTDFHNAFNAMDRGNQFSYEALNMLFNYFEEFDPEMELDVISICCSYSEMTFEDVMTSYDVENTDLLDLDDEKVVKQLVMSYLEENTMVIGVTDDSIVFEQF